MCARAPSHAVRMASIDGVPNRSVIKSSYRTDTNVTNNKDNDSIVWFWAIIFCKQRTETKESFSVQTRMQTAGSLSEHHQFPVQWGISQMEVLHNGFSISSNVANLHSLQGLALSYTENSQSINRLNKYWVLLRKVGVTCWMGLWAWNRMRRPSSSAKMHPTDQISMELE